VSRDIPKLGTSSAVKKDEIFDAPMKLTFSTEDE